MAKLGIEDVSVIFFQGPQGFQGSPGEPGESGASVSMLPFPKAGRPCIVTQTHSHVPSFPCQVSLHISNWLPGSCESHASYRVIAYDWTD